MDNLAEAMGGEGVYTTMVADLTNGSHNEWADAAAWHLAPLPATKEQLTSIVILPECIYANDCIVVDLEPEQQFEIVL